MKLLVKLFLVALCALSLSFIACNNTRDTSNDDKKDDEKQNEVNIELEYKGGDITLEEGDEQALNITLKGAEGLEYSVDKADVLKVENGKVTALSAGTCVITVSVKDHSDKKVTINVTVTAKVVEPTKYTISYDLDGGTAEGLALEFEENSFPTLKSPTKEGFNFLGWFEGEDEITSISENKNYTLKAKWEVKEILPESIEITVECEDGDIIFTDSNCVITCKVYPEGASQEVTWKNVNKTKAVRNEDGTVEVKNGNEATFKATSVANPDVVASVTIKVRGYMNPARFLDSIQVASSDIVAQDIRAYDSTAGYDTYLLGSVIKYLFEELTIDSETWMLKEDAFNRPGKVSENGCVYNLKYITVHDVGGTGDSAANARYCNNPGGREVSWHYTVGNDGIYQQIPDDEMGWHAGDGTWDPMEWYDSGVLAPEGDDTPAIITVNQVTGKFMIGEEKTKVTAPLDSNGNIVPNTKLPYTGINNYVDTNKSSATYLHYMIGKTYYNTTYNILSNRGGNLCSIGIESTVNKGSNIFYTWEKLAKLIGKRLLINGGLLPRDVKQHNTFSGKNCPQTMRQAYRWETFMEYVENEYYFALKYMNYTIEFSSNSEYLNSNGMIKTLPVEATEVSYSVRMYSTADGVDVTKDYKVTLPAKGTIKNLK